MKYVTNGGIKHGWWHSMGALFKSNKLQYKQQCYFIVAISFMLWSTYYSVPNERIQCTC